MLHDFSWGAWFWNPDKAFGIPRFAEVLNRPLYPVHLAAVGVLPTLTAWHWVNVFHVLLKVGGLVLLGTGLGWPPWLVVLASSGAMLTHGALDHFGDVIDLSAAAWLPIQLWLTIEAGRRPWWTRWDTAWVVCAALRFLGSNPNRLVYYEILILAVTIAFGRAALRREITRLALRYALTLLIVAPLLLPALAHYAESARAHFLEFTDWHFRRAYNWRNYWLRMSDLTGFVFVPYGIWLALVGALVLARGRAGPFAHAVGGYFLFALLHTVRYAPFWFLLAVLPGVRIPQKAFEPLTWLAVVALADVGFQHLEGTSSRLSRGIMIGLLVAAFASALWGTPLDPRRAYIWPPWQRGLPERLAALIRAEPRAPVLLATGPERVEDAKEPVLNSNHHFFLGIPSARFFGDVPAYPFMRATYRIPGLLLIQRAPTPVLEWELVVDLYAELGIRWVLWDGDAEPVDPRLRLVAEERGFRLYEIGEARPLIYALPELRRVERPSVPGDVAALVYTLPSLGPFCYGCPSHGGAQAAEQSRARWDWRPGLVRVDVQSTRGTYVVFGETSSRGWEATVDGIRAPIYQANEVFQAVWVPAGRHGVVWRYREPLFLVGLAMTGLGLVVCIVLHWRRVRVVVGLLLVAAVGTAAPTSAQTIREIPLPGAAFPAGVAPARDGSVWVSARFSDKLFRFDEASGRFSEVRLPRETLPHGLLADPRGNLWYAAGGRGVVGRLEREGEPPKEFATPSMAAKRPSPLVPWALTWDAGAEEIWFTVPSDGIVGRVGALAEPLRRGFQVREIRLAAPGSRPEGISADRGGRIWVADVGTDSLVGIVAADGTINRVHLPRGSHPRGVAAAPDGTIWVTLSGTHQLFRLEPASGRARTWPMPSRTRSSPYAIAVGPRGEVWVSELVGNTIARFDPRTERFTTVPLPTPRSRVRALAVDARGRVWFAASGSGRLGVIE